MGKRSITGIGVRPRSALSLIEILVAAAITALLIGLTLPAVQVVRASAGRVASQNNLRQIGLAMNGHEAANGFLPHNGGWCPFPEANAPLFPGLGGGLGDPAKSADKQTGSWCYALLPYLEQQDVFRAIRDGSRSKPVVASELKVFNIAYRRAAVGDYLRELAGPMTMRGSSVPLGSVSGLGTIWARTDYSLNAFVLDIDAPGDVPPIVGGSAHFIATLVATSGKGMKVRFVDFHDGTANTVLVGEKAVTRHQCGTVDTPGPPDDIPAIRYGFDMPAVSGGTGDTACGGLEVLRDGDACAGNNWGSPFPGGANFLFADGSVRVVPFGNGDAFAMRLRTLLTPRGGTANESLE